MKVRSVSWNRDFDAHQKEYLLAGQIGDFVHDAGDEIPLAEADVVIVEYPPLSDSPRIEGAAARRGAQHRGGPRQPHLEGYRPAALREMRTDGRGRPPTALFLNYAGRDVVQTFTGLLPPFTRLRRLGYQISQFGFTAVK